MMPKRRKQPRMAHKDETVIRCPSHLQWVRGHECAISGKYYETEYNGQPAPVFHICLGKIEAAHVRNGGNGGTGMKPGDDRTIPLCHNAHSKQHQIGERKFEARYGINMPSIAAELWAKSPHGIRYRARQDKD